MSTSHSFCGLAEDATTSARKGWSLVHDRFSLPMKTQAREDPGLSGSLRFLDDQKKLKSELGKLRSVAARKAKATSLGTRFLPSRNVSRSLRILSAASGAIHFGG